MDTSNTKHKLIFNYTKILFFLICQILAQNHPNFASCGYYRNPHDLFSIVAA